MNKNKHNELFDLSRKIANCKTNTLIGAVIKQAIIDLNLNIESKYKNNYKISARRSIRNNAINYLNSELCGIHCKLISLDYDDFIEKIDYLIQYSKEELTISYKLKKNENEKTI